MMRLADMLMLGDPKDVPSEAVFREAEAKLGVRLPASYREALGRLGRGTVGSSCWLLLPKYLQTYGSLLGGEFVKGELAEMLVFAMRDDGHYWGWSAKDLARGGESSIRHIPRTFDLDETSIVAADVLGLLQEWMHNLQVPYFVPAGPTLLVSDVAANGPEHDTLALPGSIRLFGADGMSKFYVEDAGLIVSIQTVPAAHTRASWTSALRFQWLRADTVMRSKVVLDALVAEGWDLVATPRVTFRWEEARGLEEIVALFSSYGIVLAR